MNVATLDIGTGGLHAAVYSSTGRLLQSSYEPLVYETGPTGNDLVFDPERLFRSGMRLVAAVVKRESIPGDLIIAITSQRHGSVFLDTDMEPVLGAANLDRRVDRKTVGELQRNYGEEIYRFTGRLPAEIHPAVRLQWMARNDPDRYARIHGFLMINEYISYRLCRVARAEKSSVCESLLYDIGTGTWSERLSGIFGLPHLARWDIVDGGTIVGSILTEVADEFGLPRATLVSLGAGDTQCAAVGSRAFADGDIVAVNGSTTPVVMVSDSLVFDPLRRTWSDHFYGSRYLIEGNAGKTGMAYREITEALSCTRPASDSLISASRNGMMARLVPDPWAAIDFFSAAQEIRFTGSPGNVSRMLPYLMIENTAFAIAANIENLVRVTRREPGTVFLTGGSSRSEWAQTIIAVLLEKFPLYRTATLDTTPKGAAMQALAAYDTGTVVEELFPEENLDGVEGSWLDAGSVDSRSASLIRERYEWWRSLFGRSAKVGDSL